MRIGILSDTHDQVARTRLAVKTLKAAGAEALIHCGDVTVADVVYELTGLPVFLVFGNCDEDLDGLRAALAQIGGTCLDRGALITLDDRRIAVTHGDSDRELKRLTGLSPDYLFTGHSHRRLDTRLGPIRHINPGALHRAFPWSVALLDLRSDQLESLIIPEP